MNTIPTKALLIVVFAMLAGLFTAAAVQAQEIGPTSPTDDEVNRIAKELYCPVCPNTPLDVCETKACQDWREEIRMQLADGWTEEQILAYFVDQYGERVLAEPRRGGFTSLVWVLPLMLTVLGAVLVVWLLARWQRGFEADLDRSMDLEIDPEIQKRIEEELRVIE